MFFPTRPAGPPVFLLSDFGTADHYVAVMKAVILTRCPEACIVDITHQVPPQDIEAGAYLLESAWPWLPGGSIVCAVVDPGVGSGREAAVFHSEGLTIIGPNNGLMGFLPSDLEGRVLDRPEHWEPQPSATFHGRDIFAPCAAVVAGGESWMSLGYTPAYPAPLPDGALANDRMDGRIIHFDHFGNAITSLRGELLEQDPHSAEVPGRSRCRFVKTYGDVAAGEALAYVGSTGRIEIAVREGSAREKLGLERGERVIVHMEGPLL